MVRKTVFENDHLRPSIDSNTQFKQYFSIRQQPRDCGTINISAYFAQWEKFGMNMVPSGTPVRSNKFNQSSNHQRNQGNQWNQSGNPWNQVINGTRIINEIEIKGEIHETKETNGTIITINIIKVVIYDIGGRLLKLIT
ncbi:glycoside hydrolase family 11 protein [Piromyces sp. E2]|nr:glycoside hydrolase family 11 protein [Piromyces sp. E2]|eukprot:OUM60788.1 glycoside hydrolase family 11 protein [Piromyces sp. E2]